MLSPSRQNSASLSKARSTRSVPLCIVVSPRFTLNSSRIGMSAMFILRFFLVLPIGLHHLCSFFYWNIPSSSSGSNMGSWSKSRSCSTHSSFFMSSRSAPLIVRNVRLQNTSLHVCPNTSMLPVRSANVLSMNITPSPPADALYQKNMAGMIIESAMMNPKAFSLKGGGLQLVVSSLHPYGQLILSLDCRVLVFPSIVKFSDVLISRVLSFMHACVVFSCARAVVGRVRSRSVVAMSSCV